jgi:hypothetical protein
MRSLPLRFLLLACLAFWGSGAGQFLHERLEHADPSNFQSVASERHSVVGVAGHAHGACVVCEMLASMTAGHAAVVSPALAPHDCLCTVTPFDCQSSAQTFLQFPLSRGPPAAFSIFAA